MAFTLNTRTYGTPAAPLTNAQIDANFQNLYDDTQLRILTADAVSTNTASKVVLRDANGDFAAGGLTLNRPSTLTANSTSDALRITQTGTGNALVVEDSTNVDSTPFVIDTNGNVVVGHTANIYNAKLEAHGNTIVLKRSENTTTSGTLSLVKTRGTTPASNTIVVSGDSLGAVNFQGTDGTTNLVAASIEAFVDTTPGANDMPGRLTFSTTADGASTSTARMSITNAGNVVIGSATTSSAKLHVYGDVIVEESRIDTTTTAITTTTQTEIYSYASTTYRTAELLVQIVDSTNFQYHSVKFLLIHDGATVTMIHYGVVTTAAELGTFTSSISTGSVRLFFTPTAATTKSVKVLATMLTA